MNKLTIDEIIEHCKRKTARYEHLNGIKTLENADISNNFIKEYWEHRQVAEYLEELRQYQAIGTVEECREARERQRGRKVNNRKLLRDFNKTPYSVQGDCLDCGSVGLLSMNTDYCNLCGQKLDWYE